MDSIKKGKSNVYMINMFWRMEVDITEWALSQDGVKQMEAETDAENVASQKVLCRSGFVSNGKMGEEGPRFVYGGKKGMKKYTKGY